MKRIKLWDEEFEMLIRTYGMRFGNEESKPIINYAHNESLHDLIYEYRDQVLYALFQTEEIWAPQIENSPAKAFSKFITQYKNNLPDFPSDKEAEFILLGFSKIWLVYLDSKIFVRMTNKEVAIYLLNATKEITKTHAQYLINEKLFDKYLNQINILRNLISSNLEIFGKSYLKNKWEIYYNPISETIIPVKYSSNQMEKIHLGDFFKEETFKQINKYIELKDLFNFPQTGYAPKGFYVRLEFFFAYCKLYDLLKRDVTFVDLKEFLKKEFNIPFIRTSQLTEKKIGECTDIIKGKGNKYITAIEERTLDFFKDFPKTNYL